MPNVLANALAASHAATVAVAGELLVYRIPGQEPLTLTGVPGRLETVTDGNDGAEVSSRTAEWLFLTEDLVIEGAAFLPERGHEIDWRDADDNLHTFRVVPQQDERCYKFCDQMRVKIRAYSVETVANAETL